MSTQIEELWPIPETMVDGITERLRGQSLLALSSHRERIWVADLERKFGVSHIPIREALRRLQSEGFVEISPRRTTIAAGVDLNDLANIYDLRRIIEIEIGAALSVTNDQERCRGGAWCAGRFSGSGQRSILCGILGTSPTISLGAACTRRQCDGQRRS